MRPEDTIVVSRVRLWKVRRALEWFGVSYLIACFICLIMVWTSAFLRADKGIWVPINNFGEALPELGLHIFGITCLLLLLHTLMRGDTK